MKYLYQKVDHDYNCILKRVLLEETTQKAEFHFRKRQQFSQIDAADGTVRACACSKGERL